MSKISTLLFVCYNFSKIAQLTPVATSLDDDDNDDVSARCMVTSE